MGNSGFVILLSAVALLCVIGIIVLDNLHSEVNSKDANIKQQSDTAVAIEKPLFLIFGYTCVIIASYATLSVYRDL